MRKYNTSPAVVSSKLCASAQLTKFKRLAPTVQSAQLQHPHLSYMEAKKGSQEGTSLEVLLVHERLPLEPVLSRQHAPPQWTKFNRSTPTIPAAWLQHTRPSTADREQCSKEGTTFSFVRKYSVSPYHPCDMYIPVQRTNNNISAPRTTVPTAWLQHTHPSTVYTKQRSQEGTGLLLHVVSERIVALEPVS
jgi:hypothetical protein